MEVEIYKNKKWTLLEQDFDRSTLGNFRAYGLDQEIINNQRWLMFCETELDCVSDSECRSLNKVHVNSGFCIRAFHSYIYFFSKTNSGNEKYDIKSETWSDFANQNKINGKFTPSLFNDKFYCIYGNNQMEIYDPILDQWN